MCCWNVVRRPIATTLSGERRNSLTHTAKNGLVKYAVLCVSDWNNENRKTSQSGMVDNIRSLRELILLFSAKENVEGFSAAMDLLF